MGEVDILGMLVLLLIMMSPLLEANSRGIEA